MKNHVINTLSLILLMSTSLPINAGDDGKNSLAIPTHTQPRPRFGDQDEDDGKNSPIKPTRPAGLQFGDQDPLGLRQDDDAQNLLTSITENPVFKMTRTASASDFVKRNPVKAAVLEQALAGFTAHFAQWETGRTEENELDHRRFRQSLTAHYMKEITKRDEKRINDLRSIVLQERIEALQEAFNDRNKNIQILNMVSLLACSQILKKRAEQETTKGILTNLKSHLKKLQHPQPVIDLVSPQSGSSSVNPTHAGTDIEMELMRPSSQNEQSSSLLLAHPTDQQQKIEIVIIQNYDESSSLVRTVSSTMDTTAADHTIDLSGIPPTNTTGATIISAIIGGDNNTSASSSSVPYHHLVDISTNTTGATATTSLALSCSDIPLSPSSSSSSSFADQPAVALATGATTTAQLIEQEKQKDDGKKEDKSDDFVVVEKDTNSNAAASASNASTTTPLATSGWFLNIRLGWPF